jgi:hypothetical protein
MTKMPDRIAAPAMTISILPMSTNPEKPSKINQTHSRRKPIWCLNPGVRMISSKPAAKARTARTVLNPGKLMAKMTVPPRAIRYTENIIHPINEEISGVATSITTPVTRAKYGRIISNGFKLEMNVSKPDMIKNVPNSIKVSLFLDISTS